MPLPAASFELEVVSRELVRPDGEAACTGQTQLSAYDALTLTTVGWVLLLAGWQLGAAQAAESVLAFRFPCLQELCSCAPCPLLGMQATVRAWGFRGARIDPRALAAAVRATLTDLPVLAGRYGATT